MNPTRTALAAVVSASLLATACEREPPPVATARPAPAAAPSTAHVPVAPVAVPVTPPAAPVAAAPVSTLEPGEAPMLGLPRADAVAIRCDIQTTSSQCIENLAGLPSMSRRVAVLLEQVCNVQRGTPARTTACPSANRVFTCDYNDGFTRRHYYSTGPMHYTHASAEQHCTRFRAMQAAGGRVAAPTN